MNYLVFDFETTGLSPVADRIIQTGICKVIDGVVAESASWIVKQPISISPAAERVHGISNKRMEAEGISPQDSLARLVAYLQDAEQCVGHNIHLFDIPFLLAEANRYDVICPDYQNYVDTAALYKGWQLGLSRGSRTHREYALDVLSRRVIGLKYSVTACIQKLGVSVDVSMLHDAGRDCYATHLIYEKMQQFV